MGTLSGQVMTVAGPVAPRTLGVTQPHEHVFISFLAFGPELWEPSPAAYPRGQGSSVGWDDPVTPRNYHRVRRDDALVRDMQALTDEGEAVEALGEFRAAGGGCIVDVTPVCIARNPAALARVSAASGVPIVMGCGWYVHYFHAPEIATLSEAALAERLLVEIAEGADGTGIRPGIIGEIGLSHPMHPDEAKVLTAAARVQAATGYALTIHPGRDRDGPWQALRIVEAAGGDPARTVIGHLDRTFFDDADFVALARTGCWLEQDLFGFESSYYPYADIDMPNDAIRVRRIRALADAGFLDRALVSMDVYNKARLTKYGGEGYQHILWNVAPLMRRRGLSDAEVMQVLAGNPQRMLTIR
jgi:phosphotriesterase-related protein